MSSIHSLVLYIGNGVVKSGIVAYKDGKSAPTILSLDTKELKFSHSKTRKDIEARILIELRTLVTKTIHETLPRLVKEHGKIHITQAMAAMATPWYSSEMIIAKKENKEPELISEQYISNLLMSATSEFDSRNNVVLENRILGAKLNGYHLHNPVGKKARTVELSVFRSFAPKETLRQIRDIILSIAHIRKIHVQSQSFVAYASIQSIFPEERNYVVCDVTSEVSEVLVSRDNILAESVTFPFGKREIIKELSKELGAEESVTTSLIGLLEKGTIDQSLKDKVAVALVKIMQNWLSSFTGALTQASIGASLPHRVYLFSPKDVAWIFEHAIIEEGYHQFAFAESTFEVRILSTADMSPYCVYTTEETKDPTFAITALFNGTRLQEK